MRICLCFARLVAQERVARSARPIKIGTLRPAIVLYDEAHPLGDDIGAIQTSDMSRRPDLLVVMGTSLKVHGLRRLVREFAKVVHGGAPEGKKSQYAYKVVFVNKTPPGSEWAGIIDYHVGGETDAWAGRVLDDWKRIRPADWEVQQTLDGEGVFRHVKDGAASTGKGKGKGKGEWRRLIFLVHYSPADHPRSEEAFFYSSQWSREHSAVAG